MGPGAFGAIGVIAIIAGLMVPRNLQAAWVRPVLITGGIIFLLIEFARTDA